MISIKPTITRWGATALAIFSMLSAGGCGATPQARQGDMGAAMTEYNAQRYGQAQQQASAVMQKSTGSQRERAAYIAGLSAYQAGDLSAAERDLGAASVSSDPAIAGSAKAMLGQVRLDQRRPREAAGNFADASRLLKGEDARQAAWHAGLAYRQAGDEASAKRWLDLASSRRFDESTSSAGAVASTGASSAPPANSRVAASPSNGRAATVPTSAQSSQKVVLQPPTVSNVGFSLQVGAFSDKQRAKTAAEEAEALAHKESLGRVKVFPRRDVRGQTIYMVHLGWWATRAEANAARSSLGRLEYIVAPAPPE